PPPPFQLNPQVPLKLNEIIIRALEKDRNMRYQTATDLKADLQRAKRDSSDAQTAVSDWAHPARRTAWRGRSVILGLAALGVVFFLLLRLSLSYFQAAGETIDSIAVLPFANMSGSPDSDYLSDGITETLIDSLSELPNLKVMSH